MSVQPPDPPGIRISDADRERAAARLNQALAEGRISVSELEERLTVVYGARYEAELRPPLADLPGVEVTATPVTLPLTHAGPPLVLRAGMSGLKRTGRWTVPARMRVQSVLGSVVLDFCEAENPHPVVEIELDLGAGPAKLLVPDDATANIDDLVAGMGTATSKVPSRQRTGAPHFVVHGCSRMGSVLVRRRYRFAGRSF